MPPYHFVQYKRLQSLPISRMWFKPRFDAVLRKASVVSRKVRHGLRAISAVSRGSLRLYRTAKNHCREPQLEPLIVAASGEKERNSRSRTIFRSFVDMGLPSQYIVFFIIAMSLSSLLVL